MLLTHSVYLLCATFSRKAILLTVVGLALTGWRLNGKMDAKLLSSENNPIWP